MKDIEDIYVNFWSKPKTQFSEMELALMEGGHSIEQEKTKFSFIKSLKEVPATLSNKD